MVRRIRKPTTPSLLAWPALSREVVRRWVVRASVAGLLADPDRCRAMGENGRRLVAAEFSIDAMVDHVAGLYKELLGARGGGGR